MMHFTPIGLKKNIQWCEDHFSERGFSTERIATPTVPLLLASQSFPDAEKTVLIYLQIDGQPVDPSRWTQKDPYTPVLKRPSKNGSWEEIAWNNIKNYQDDWRVFARSASDAKGPVAMFLTAFDALKSIRQSPNYNIKVIMDFEEELVLLVSLRLWLIIENAWLQTTWSFLMGHCTDSTNPRSRLGRGVSLPLSSRPTVLLFLNIQDILVIMCPTRRLNWPSYWPQ